MPFIEIKDSPLAHKPGPVEIYYREYGDQSRLPLIFLHGGWGYQIYPFDRQIERFSPRFRILIPDRSGYGRTSKIEDLPADFHQHAATEMFNFLDALKIDRAVLWGHSDGAVIAAIMGIRAPARFAGLIMEACHYDREKAASREFFENMAFHPTVFGERVREILAQEHGDDYWQKLLMAGGRAWLRIAAESGNPAKDLYDNRLAELSCPALFIHGSSDPRTESDELAKVAGLLPAARFGIIKDAGHSPHSQESAAAETIRLAADFFDQLGL